MGTFTITITNHHLFANSVDFTSPAPVPR